MEEINRGNSNGEFIRSPFMCRTPCIFWRREAPVSMQRIGFTSRGCHSLRNIFRISIHFIIATGIKPIFFFPACSVPRPVFVRGRQPVLESTNPVSFLFHHTSYPLRTLFILTPLLEVVQPANHYNPSGRVPSLVPCDGFSDHSSHRRGTSFYNLDFLCLLSSHSQIYFFNQIL